MNASKISGSFKGVAAIGAGIGVGALMFALFGGEGSGGRHPNDFNGRITTVAHREGETDKDKNAQAVAAELTGLVKRRPAPEFVTKGVEWLVKAQHPNGGWGAGSHAKQDIRDPHAVQVDPATTAFVASALLRYGNTPVEGMHKDNVRRATEYLCGVVEEYTKPGPKITDLEGTQIQAKLGPLVDTAMTAQYLARVLATVPTSDPLRARIDKSLDKCLAKLNESQQKDGSWNVGGGWANVLQSSLGCSAMEYAQAAGKKIDGDRLEKARKYQLGNYDAKTGQVRTEASAGVALYAYNGSLRANAAQAQAANEFIDRAKRDGKLAADAPVSAENLKIAGVDADEDVDALINANLNVTAQVALLNGVQAPTSVAAAGATPIAPVAGDLAASVATAPVGRPVAAPALPSITALDVAGPAVIDSPTEISFGTGSLSVARISGGGYAGGTVVTGGRTLATGPGTAGASDEEALLAGFGNNGGEEFLSYMLASESMVIMGDKDWAPWFDKMSGRLSKVMNPDGSFSGHHCITSPVFCTAAVVQTMTADRDAEMLAKLAKDAAALAKVDVKK